MSDVEGMLRAIRGRLGDSDRAIAEVAAFADGVRATWVDEGDVGDLLRGMSVLVKGFGALSEAALHQKEATESLALLVELLHLRVDGQRSKIDYE